MPRYVILEHDWPMRHWDLLLEAGESLRAWRLLEEPRTGGPIPAEANLPHRLFYLDYEGPIPGDRGQVQRWDSGTFIWVENEPERAIFDLEGNRLTGRFVIADTSFRPL
ncbi:MAG TPA: DNA polymerase ligase N-terminal domain-containing protein [Urbifossiella sp.]|nr:DNA polymerase ligase N-terminal domain-containing protein [Urbifossiella sp.]